MKRKLTHAEMQAKSSESDQMSAAIMAFWALEDAARKPRSTLVMVEALTGHDLDRKIPGKTPKSAFSPHNGLVACFIPKENQS